MSERNYYVLCENNCKFPAMTKEQILAAIAQAVETGEIKDVDTGFVTKLQEQNGGKALTFWIGTRAEYNALETKKENCFYILTDDTSGEDLDATIKSILDTLATKASFDYVDANFKRVKKIKFGSYLGSGGAGESSRTGLNFVDFEPCIVFLFSAERLACPPAIWKKGNDRIYAPLGMNYGATLECDVLPALNNYGEVIEGAYMLSWFANGGRWRQFSEENEKGYIVGMGIVEDKFDSILPVYQYDATGSQYYYLAFGL